MYLLFNVLSMGHPGAAVKRPLRASQKPHLPAQIGPMPRAMLSGFVRVRPQQPRGIDMVGSSSSILAPRKLDGDVEQV